MIKQNNLKFYNNSSYYNNNGKVVISHYSKFTFSENLFLYLSASIVNDSSVFNSYTGKPRPQSRFGFNSRETEGLET